MNTLVFSGKQDTAEADILLEAELNGRPIGVRVTTDAIQDFGLSAAQDKAVEKAQAGRFEAGGGLRVTTSDFSE